MKVKGLYIVLIFASSLWFGCNEGTFRSDVKTPSKPWKHQNFDAAPEKFSFAVFSDLTGGERPEVFKVAIEQLNLLRPEFIVNVGDLIEGVSSDTAEWHRQWNSFDQRASKARAPIFYMGGNHDLTGELSRHVWKERHGPRYYHFRYKDVLFLVLDTEDNSLDRMREITRIRQEAIEIYKAEGEEAFNKSAYGKLPERRSGTIGKEQADYFKRVIAENQNVPWTFVLIHKPAWTNNSEQNFATIEKALSRQAYTVFYGHSHVYKHETRFGRDYINLSTTGGEQYPEKGKSFDHLMWVTVDKNGVSMANLKLKGILDKKAQIPLGGDSLEFEKSIAK